MTYTRVIALLFIVLLLPASAQAQTAIIELFTTQTCSSCPPADKYVKQMADEDSDLLVLACHVDYFDSEAWKDDMAQPFCKARHSAYLAAGTLGRIATPALVVNGEHNINGANEKLTRDAVKMVRSVGDLGTLRMERRDGNLEIGLPDIPMSKPAEIWLFSFDPSKTVDITGGENASKEIDYINIVTNLTKLMEWNGQHQNLAYPLSDLPEGHHAVIVQEKNYGRVIAAGTLTN